jgi:Tfp pilus assembly protein PilF
VPEFYYNLAYAYLNTNNLQKAEQQVLLCLSLNRSFGQAYQLYAQILNAQGRQNDAKQLMQQYSQFF